MSLSPFPDVVADRDLRSPVPLFHWPHRPDGDELATYADLPVFLPALPLPGEPIELLGNGER
jgi:hypothetical protein